MVFGIDVGTTSVSGVAVDADGCVAATASVPHEADLPRREAGVDEQDPERLLSATQEVVAQLQRAGGRPRLVGWTGQMHGVVAVDRNLHPLTPFVTWRDARRYGGRVMEGWLAQGLAPHKCLCAPGFACARLLGGEPRMDPTFHESWHVDGRTIPAGWLPKVAECSMLGDNQAGVYAAQKIMPGCAVVNLGTSGQLSVVRDEASPHVGEGAETRLFVPGKRLVCRPSLLGGQVWSALRSRLGIPWEEMNARAESDAEIRRCADAIVDDLFVGMDVTGVTGLVGVGNALRRNPALIGAVERRSGMRCVVPEVVEMAAYGAALHAIDVEARRA